MSLEARIAACDIAAAFSKKKEGHERSWIGTWRSGDVNGSFAMCNIVEFINMALDALEGELKYSVKGYSVIGADFLLKCGKGAWSMNMVDDLIGGRVVIPRVGSVLPPLPWGDGWFLSAASDTQDTSSTKIRLVISEDCSHGTDMESMVKKLINSGCHAAVAAYILQHMMVDDGTSIFPWKGVNLSSENTSQLPGINGCL